MKGINGRVNPPEAQQTIAPITFFSNTKASQRRAHIPIYLSLQINGLISEQEITTSHECDHDNFDLGKKVQVIGIIREFRGTLVEMQNNYLSSKGKTKSI